jgi:hypothetical protein
VDDASIMRPSQRARYLNSVTQNRFRSESHLSGQAVEGLAFDQFHDDVQVAANLAYVINRADIGMSQGGGSASLLQQILPARCIQGCILLDNFDRHVAMEDFIVGAIYNSHSSFAYLGNDAAVPENFADHNDSSPSNLGCRLELRQRRQLQYGVSDSNRARNGGIHNQPLLEDTNASY